MDFEWNMTRACYLTCNGGVPVAEIQEKDGRYTVFSIMPILASIRQAESDCLDDAIEKFKQNCQANPEAMRRFNEFVGKSSNE